MEQPVEIKLSYNVKLNKIIFLRLIQKRIGSGEMWFGDLEDFMKSDIINQFGLSYKKGSLYRFLDQLAKQGYIVKYLRPEPNNYSYFGISKQGFQILEKMEDIFEKKQKIIEESPILKKESFFDDSEKMELIENITTILAGAFFGVIITAAILLVIRP